MSWAILGDIEFDILNSPQSFSDRSGVVWSEHALIKGKSQLEYSGDELDEINLDIILHSQLVNTELQLTKLKEAKAKHKPLPFVLGDGFHKGYFVIVSIDTNHTRTTIGGTAQVATIQLLLKEYSGTVAAEAPKKAILDSSSTYIDAQKQAELQSPTQDVLKQTRSAINVLSGGIDAYKTVKDDPMSAPSSLTRILLLTEQSTIPLTNITLSELDNMQQLSTAATNALSNVNQAISYLTDPSLGNELNKISAASVYAEKALSHLEGAEANEDALTLLTNVINRRAI